MLPEFLFAAVLFSAALHDKKKFYIPDYLSATAWLLFAITMPPSSHSFAVMMFGATFFAREIGTRLKKNGVFGLGDVIWLPLICAYMESMVGGNWIMLIASSSVLAIWIEKRENSGQPLVFFWAIGYLIALFFPIVLLFI